MLKIDTIKQNERISTQDLLLKIEDAVKAGETDFEIASSEQHDIDGSLWHPERKTLKFHATNAGQRVGSMCLPNTEIIVEDSTSADVGWLNAGGIITVKGDTGDTVEHCSSGGKIYIGIRAGTRTGSLMKHDPFYEEPELLAKKNVGRFSFEFMGDGRAVVCVVDSEKFSSVLGDRPCVGMVGGIVYFRGNISDYQKDILYLELDEYGIAFLKGGIFSDVAVNDFQVLRNGKIDDAIKIGELGLKSANIEIEPPQNLTGKKTGIIGGGVAGLSTAWQLRLLGHEVTVYDDAEKIGGKIVYPFLTKKITDEEIFADVGRFIESDQVIVLIGEAPVLDYLPNDESIKKFRDWIVPLAEKKILPKVCIDAMAKTVQEMGKAETFRGYGPEHGYLFLREKIAVGDPVYPVYLDSNVMTGHMGNFNDGKFDGVTYLPCTEENNFSPVPLTFG